MKMIFTFLMVSVYILRFKNSLSWLVLTFLLLSCTLNILI